MMLTNLRRGASALAPIALALALIAGAATRPARAAPSCDELALSVVADGAGDDEARWARGLWQALLTAGARVDLGPGEPRMTLVAGPAIGPGAWYCAGADTVYVARALVDYAWLGRASDGADLLAFAVAHELAHRRFDRATAVAAARPFAVAPCPDVDPAVEARADRRAAFLLATADNPETGRGFSPFGLARRDALAAFFEGELGWGSACPAVVARLDAVADALGHIGELALAWDTALDLAFGAADRDAPEAAGVPLAVDLLTALERGASDAGHWSALPELSVLAALVHLERAGRAGWCRADLARTDLDPDPCTLACAVVFPRFARVSPMDREGRRAAGIDPGHELARARSLLDAARAAGVPAADLAGAEACAAYLRRDPDAALDALAVLGAGQTARVRAAVRDDRRLFALQRFLLEEPAPPGTPAWTDALGELATRLGWDASPTSAAMAAWLDARPRAAERPPALAPTLAGGLALPPCPPAEGRAVVLGDLRIERGGACTRVIRGGRAAATLASLPLGAATASLGAWLATCAFGLPGVADDGLALLTARDCAEGDPSVTWVLHARDERVERAVRVWWGDAPAP